MTKPNEELAALVKEYVNKERGNFIGDLFSVPIVGIVDSLKSSGYYLGGRPTAWKVVKKVLRGFKINDNGRIKNVLEFYSTRQRDMVRGYATEWDRFYNNEPYAGVEREMVIA